METILTLVVIWFAVSIVASLLLGRFLGVINQRQMARKSLSTPSRTTSDNDAYRTISFARATQTIRNR
jgi:hypothetical protein